MQIIGKTNIDFLAKRKTLIWLSLVINFIGLVAPMPFALGLHFGIDFTGGQEVALSFSKPINTAEIREALANVEVLVGSEIKSYGKENQFLLRTPIITTEQYAQEITPLVKKVAPNAKITRSAGNEFTFDLGMVADTNMVHKALDNSMYSDASVELNPNQANLAVVRIPGIDRQIVQILKQKYPEEAIEVLKVDSIGPKVGRELATQALIAVILAVLMIGIYIAFRFEFVYGIGAAIALIHDVFVTLALVTVFGKLEILNLEINQGMIAAFLTVIGFSVHDTVIIFDRVRENREKHKGMNIIELMNLSINETLSRTINTVLTVVFVLLTMVLLGGEVLEGFAFTMLVGIVTGVYSSVYIASAFVIWYLQHVKKLDVEGDYAKMMEKAKAKQVRA